MNVKLCIKITLGVWFVDRLKETCISLYVKICVCDFIDWRKEKKSQDPRSVVRSFGILHQAVRWHSLHARNSNFVLSNLCGERTESAGLPARVSPTLRSRLNAEQQHPWLDHKQAKGGGIAVVRGKYLQLAGKWKVNSQLTRFREWFFNFAARRKGRKGRWGSSSFSTSELRSKPKGTFLWVTDTALLASIAVTEQIFCHRLASTRLCKRCRTEF